MRTSIVPGLLTVAGRLVSAVAYDYIIVGGGSAGIIVAERLAETQKSVLLLERGGPSTFATGDNNTLAWNSSVTAIDVPALGYVLRDTSNGAFCTDTASNAGCVLGGSGSVNALIFVPPQESDFATWPEGWRWEDGVRDSAAALYERNPGTSLASSDGLRYDYSVYDIFGDFLAGNGWTEVDAIEQPNEKHNVFSYPPWNIKDSVRAGPVKTYLPLAKAFRKFELRLHTKVVRITRNGTIAIGVEVQNADGSLEAIALTGSTGKVVLAAGSMSTPRVLFNSGIGPYEQIETVANSNITNITLPPRADWINLPVGLGVKDHPMFYINLNLSDSSANNVSVYNPQLPSKDETFQYNSVGAGVLAQGPQRLNFWSSRESPEDGVTRFFQGTVVAEKDNTIQLKIYLTRGLTSTGVLGINAEGNTYFPTWPWLTAAEDKTAIISFLNETIALLKTNSKAWTLADWVTGQEIVNAEMLLETYTAGAHFVSTARLGDVVDLNTRVIGTENVFVVDASMHFDLPTGNTNAMTMVVAEHAAKKIIALDNQD
ncbi:hypothetical protein N0V93_002545 [Gnomoniopsis smithogilvyi]|uniref:Glucose-methanol-choline oxidoreductase N-terminal domain-containing protein n=1 Tax=Gnomoniopsis smithogilvyi TaxID=1191159 RepID=A0A9W8YYU1_9PEZI|nr:hypothetical protein N0V93_002545 [Gnomoniopsis smithogilvyi]